MVRGECWPRPRVVDGEGRRIVRANAVRRSCRPVRTADAAPEGAQWRRGTSHLAASAGAAAPRCLPVAAVARGACSAKQALCHRRANAASPHNSSRKPKARGKARILRRCNSGAAAGGSQGGKRRAGCANKKREPPANVRTVARTLSAGGVSREMTHHGAHVGRIVNDGILWERTRRLVTCSFPAESAARSRQRSGIPPGSGKCLTNVAHEFVLVDALRDTPVGRS
jgi:hypothetical protein